MRAVRFEGVNVCAAPPAGLEEMVGTLYCFHNGRTCVSSWEPEDREAFAKYILDGGNVFISVMSGSKHDVMGKWQPTIIPVYVGMEDDCERVASDTGRTWK